MIRADRHLGQAFANGAHDPVSRYGRRFTYHQAVDLVLRLVEFFEKLLARVRPRVLVTAPADTARMALDAVAQSAGIPLRIPCQNFSNDALQWRANRYYWPPGLAEAFKRESAMPTSEAGNGHALATVEDTHRTEYARRELNAGQSVMQPIRRSYLAVRREIGSVVKRRQRTYGGYRLGDQLSAIFGVWRERRRMIRQKPLMERLLGQAPYVFYPLVVEPETTLQCESPMADNQLTIIDWLAKTLPAGWRVIVKEHPGFTYPRPRFFWKEIRRYPNVEIAAVYESGEQLAQNAAVLAVINGTLGIQAASAGIPVLTFNPFWWGRFLPHVAYAASYEQTAEALRVLADPTKLPHMAERQRLGAALQRALDVDSIYLEDTRILEEKALGEPTPAADIKSIVDALLRTLNVATGADLDLFGITNGSTSIDQLILKLG